MWPPRGAALSRALLSVAALACCLPGSPAQSTGGDDTNVTNGTNCTNGTNGTNGTNCTVFTGPCETSCCSTHVRQEAYLACKEFMGFGLDEPICQSWGNYAQADCEFFCSDCNKIAWAIYGQCLFYLQMQISFSIAYAMCQEIRSVFEEARCPSACVDKTQDCYTEEFEACNKICGNYHFAPGAPSDGCACYRNRRVGGYPDVCDGETVLTGEVPDSMGLQYSCQIMPATCKNIRKGTDCGLYTYCPVDLCVVKNITCPFVDDCQSAGVCNKRDGKCYYTSRPDGERCSDGIVWTWGDTCLDGTCIGTEDKCMRYNTDCSTLNPCLVPRMLPIYDGNVTNCDTGTGSCMFEQQPDGTECASLVGGPIDGRCREGLCRQLQPYKCVGRAECPDLGPCYDPSDCDNVTGLCIKRPKAEGTACNDGRSNTYRDICMEGRCVGHPFKVPEFQILGDGDCISHLPSLAECQEDEPCIEPDSRPTPRYYHDVLDAEACEVQCRDDPECTAYSFGHHVCSIYGTKRKHDPSADYWGRPWRLETTTAYITHEVTCWQKTEGDVWDFLVVVRKALFAITLTMILGIPVCFVCCQSYGTMKDSHRRMCGEGSKIGVPEPPQSPKGGASVAQALTSSNGGEDEPFTREEKVQLFYDQHPGDEPDEAAKELSPTSPGAMSEITRDPRGEVTEAGGEHDLSPSAVT